MSTHKYFNKICCVVLVLTLLLTVVFMHAGSFGIRSASKVKGYETRLFDTSRVHTVNIVIDDWDGFLANCTDEEYVACAVVIDNESYKNVAIRAKGNTSLTNVQNYGNNRYSFKIEFDHYDQTESYHGLDKLSLNNIIQDNTYIKDYLCYQMMGAFGADAPLCSFVQICVNGEEWGLYLAVEGVEDAFLERNYGKNYGNLYKPDSQSMGAGRGNGGKFNMDDWEADEFDPNENISQNDGASAPAFSDMQIPDQQTEMQRPDKGDRGQFGDAFGLSIEEIKTILQQLGDESTEQLAAILGYADTSALLAALDTSESVDAFLNGKDLKEIAQLFMQQGGMEEFRGGGKGDIGGDMGGGMGGGMGSDDVKLLYTDDNYSSYSNIFNNAKTDITDADKDRLIASLKSLNENGNIEDVVNTEEVIRYFVVHNFVCNFDSYTGSMIHNYYLYEKDGMLSMIPWDYNLAFGSFVGGSDATNMVNFPIDSPVSGGTTDSRPMLAWIFNQEEYTEQYHRYFADFIADYFDSGYFSEMIDSLKEMISPYVQSDPTKFCTYEEFEKGIDSLKEFCLLRAESVRGQLDGSIPSTSDGQSADRTALIDASAILITDMGSMNSAMGGGMNGGMERPDEANQPENMTVPDMSDPENGFQADMSQANGNEVSENAGSADPTVNEQQSEQTFVKPTGDRQMPDGQMPDGQMPDGQMPDGQMSGGQMPDGQMSGGQMPGGQMPDGQMSGGQMPDGQMSGGQMPDGQMPGGQMPDGQMPDGQMPGTQSADNPTVDEQVTEAQLPGEQVPPSDPVQDGDSQTAPNRNESGGMSNGKPGEMPENTKDQTAQWIAFAMSCLLLVAGLIFVLLYKKRA